jgi:hypothetical protein
VAGPKGFQVRESLVNPPGFDKMHGQFSTLGDVFGVLLDIFFHGLDNGCCRLP